MAEMTELKQDMYNLAKEIYNSWVIARLRGTEKYLDVTYWAEKEVE